MFIEIHKNSFKCYCKDKKRTILHNEYGCSCSHSDGYKTYHINNKYHNPHGPAIIYSNGRFEYWLNGIRI